MSTHTQAPGSRTCASVTPHTSSASDDCWASAPRPRMTLPAPAISRLGGLARRFSLRPGAEQRLHRLAELLACDPLAPTGIRKPTRIVDDHLADSLVALELAVVSAAAVIADIGSGPGIPGLPLAIALPDAEVYLLESNRRKAEFIERAAVECGIGNAHIVLERIEAWRDGVDSCDVVTARALASLNVVLEYAAPLLKLGGALVAWRGCHDSTAEATAVRAAALLGMEPMPPVRVSPYPDASCRHLHVIAKVAPTPPGFPRRVGMATKRPLGV
jgi:16S rRNA (guanine527-N7)-methyltransferase